MNFLDLRYWHGLGSEHLYLTNNTNKKGSEHNMKSNEEIIYQKLHDTFGVEEFRPSQKEVILRTLDGEHSLVLMPTGMGKSLCYQLPALIFEGLTIVISPLIALMKDQVDQLKKLGIDAAFVNSSLGKGGERDPGTVI